MEPLFLAMIIGVPLVITLIAYPFISRAERKEERVTRAGWGGRPEISRVWIVDSKTNSNVSTKTGSAVGRGVVGGAMFGVPGALIGAGSAKKNVTQGDTWVTFLVEWDDGSEEKVNCKMGDDRYCKLIKYVR